MNIDQIKLKIPLEEADKLAKRTNDAIKSLNDKVESARLVHQMTYGVRNCFKVHFNPDDLIKVEEKEVFDAIFPSTEGDIISQLVDTVSLYSDISSTDADAIPLGDKSYIVEYITEYLAQRQSVFQLSGKLNINSMIKRQIIFQSIRDAMATPHGAPSGASYVPIVKSLIKHIGINDSVVLFYPTADSVCLFDIICMHNELVTALIDVVGKPRFTSFMMGENIIKRHDKDIVVPFEKYLLMNICKFGVADIPAATNVITSPNMFNIFNQIDLDGTIATSDSTSVKVFDREFRDIEILAMTFSFDVYVTDAVGSIEAFDKVMNILGKNESNKIIPYMFLQSVGMLDAKNLAFIRYLTEKKVFDISNLLYVLNKPITVEDYEKLMNKEKFCVYPDGTAEDEFKTNHFGYTIEEIHETALETIDKIMHDAHCLYSSMAVGTNDLICDRCYASQYEKLDDYFTLELSDGTKLSIETIKFFQNVDILTKYFTKVYEEKNEKGLQIIADNIDELIGKRPADDYMTIGAATSYVSYFLELANNLCDLPMWKALVDYYFSNDVFLDAMFTVGNNKSSFTETLSKEKVNHIIEKTDKDSLSGKSSIALTMLDMLLNETTNSNLPSDWYINAFNFTSLVTGTTEYPANYSDIGEAYTPHIFKHFVLKDYSNVYQEILPHVSDDLKSDIKSNLYDYLHFYFDRVEDNINAEIDDYPESDDMVSNLLDTKIITKEDLKDCVLHRFSYEKLSDVFGILLIPEARDFGLDYSTMFASLCKDWQNASTTFADCIKKLSILLHEDIIYNTIYNVGTELNSASAQANVMHYEADRLYSLIKKYFAFVKDYDDEVKTKLFHVFLKNDKSINHIYSVHGPLGVFTTLSNEFIDSFFKIEGMDSGKQDEIRDIMTKILGSLNVAFGAAPSETWRKILLSTEFCNRVSDYLLVQFTENPANVVNHYNNILKYVRYIPEELGKSRIFHTEYWKYNLHNGMSAINNFFSVSLSTGNAYSRQLLISKIKFFVAYLDSHEKPCTYADISAKLNAIFTTFINVAEVTENLIAMIEKLDGLYEFMSSDTVVDNLFKNITLCKSLLNKLSHEQQIEMLNSETANLQFIMETDFEFYLSLVDKFGLKCDVDLTNPKIAIGIQTLTPQRVYDLYSNGFIKCNFWDLINQIPDILHLAEVELTDDIIDNVFKTQDCNKMVIIVLNKLKKKKDKDLYDVKFCKILSNYVENDPFNLSDFLGKVEFTMDDICRDESVKEKIFESCKSDPSLYRVISMESDDVPMFANMRMQSGDLMLSYYRDDKKLATKMIPYITIDTLFAKNRMGKYVIEGVLTDYLHEIWEQRDDYAEIESKLEELNITMYSIKDPLSVLLKQSDTSSNRFMLLCQTLDSENMAELLNEMNDVDINKLMSTMDDKMNNGVFYITRYHPDILETNIDRINDELFDSANIFGETLGMYALRYCDKSYTILEEKGKITESHNYININTGSLLTYALKYSKERFKAILSAPYINKYSIYVKDKVDMIDFTDEDLERVKCTVNLTNVIIAMENVPAFTLFLQKYPGVMNRHLNEMFTIRGDECYSLKYALLVEPEIARIIIGSSFCTPDLIEKFCNTFPERDFSCVANIQPASWEVLWKSVKFNHVRPAQVDQYHYGKKTNVGYIVEKVPDLRPIYTKKQVYSFNHDNVCKICQSARASILHSKSGYRMCVCCSLIEKECPVSKIKTPIDQQYYIA
jgi:hypothetical protein